MYLTYPVMKSVSISVISPNSSSPSSLPSQVSVSSVNCNVFATIDVLAMSTAIDIFSNSIGLGLKSDPGIEDVVISEY